jgi:23S rRNA maturation mini-RNase III
MIIWPSYKESEEHMPKIRFEEESLGLIVRNRQGLRVPINQRSYAWEPSHVEDLFTDLNGAITKGASEYFLGSIIVVNPPDQSALIEVYDGQQRIATTMILIAAVRDFFALSLKDENVAKIITGDSLLSVSRRGKESAHFTLSAADHSFFVSHVLREPEHPDRKAARTDPKKVSHELIQAAATSAAAFVKTITKNLPADVQASTLQKWLDFLEDGARVIWVEVQDQATAYRIFETMNDRGLKLSAADLVKNYLYSLLDEKQPDQSEQITLRWQSMSAILESLGHEDGDVVDYIRYFWITTHGHTRSGDLFDKVKAEVNSAAGALAWAETLQKRADDYAAILTPTHDAWSTYHQEVRAQLDTIRYLGVSQIRPLLLAAFGKFSDKELQRLIKNTVNWSVRCLIVGVPSGNLEGVYSKNAKAISEGIINNVDELGKQLVTLIPADDRFEAAVRTAVVPTASLARYYLRKLQIVADGIDQPQYTPNDGKAVTLEHILPQKPGSDWTLPPDKMRELYNRLGNQALLEGSINSSIGNVGFNAKRAALAASPFSLTNTVTKSADWGEKEIGDRQNTLAALAVKAWPFLV